MIYSYKVLFDLFVIGEINLQEYQNGTNPFVADTDGDGLADNLEVTLAEGLQSDTLQHLSMIAPAGVIEQLGRRQPTYPTSALKSDTDGDTAPDGYEILLKATNPLAIDSDR